MQRRIVRARVALLSLAVLCAGGAAAYFAAVRHLPLALPVRPARPVPAELDRAYRCDPALPLEVERLGEERDGGLRVLRGRFLARRAGGREPHEVRFAFYHAATVAPPAPAFVVTPILGGPNEVARIVARDLARHGMHAMIVDRRRPRELGSLEAWEEALADMVADRRRAIDWLQTLPEVDPQRIGAYGVSLGGITTALLAALEPRLQVAVIVMAGGDLPSVIARSVEPECRQLREASGLGPGADEAQRVAFEQRARRVLRTDPLRYAAHVDPRKVVMFLTRRDTSVDTAAQYRLWRAMGQPEAWSLPTGHYSAILYLPLITDRARRFIRARFAREEGPHPRSPIRLGLETKRAETGVR